MSSKSENQRLFSSIIIYPLRTLHIRYTLSIKLSSIYLFHQPVKFRHRTGLDGVHDVNVGLHGLVIGVAGPFHHDVRRDAEGQGVYNESATAGVGADEFPLGLDLVGADVAFVGGDADFLIDAGELAQLLDVAVHRLVGIVRKGLVVLEGGVLVFLQNIPGNLVQFD